MERRGRDFIGRSRGGIWCLNLLGINSGRHSLLAEVTAALMAGGGRRSDRWVPRVSERERERVYRFGFFPGLRADSLTGPNRCPGPFSGFSSFLLFPFSVFYFFHNFHIGYSNDFKPICKIF
jgi:hypothetical protein